MIKDDLLTTAGLAHLGMGEAELEAALPAFERMLGYFAAMRAAEEIVGVVSAIDFFDGFRAVPMGALRPDQAENDSDVAEKLLDTSPERDGRFILVPNVL